MNSLDIKMICKGMLSVTLYPKEITESIKELNEDIKLYYNNSNIQNFNALNKIMFFRMVGQFFIAIYLLSMMSIAAYELLHNNEKIAWIAIVGLYLPYVLLYFYFKGVKNGW